MVPTMTPPEGTRSAGLGGGPLVSGSWVIELLELDAMAILAMVLKSTFNGALSTLIFIVFVTLRVLISSFSESFSKAANLS